VLEESDYYPYGQERVVTGTGALNYYKYTGHERDIESSLDHTLYRQLSSAQGRWLSYGPWPVNPKNGSSEACFALISGIETPRFLPHCVGQSGADGERRE
jgi:RHS repeat-associated protein